MRDKLTYTGSLRVLKEVTLVVLCADAEGRKRRKPLSKHLKWVGNGLCNVTLHSAASTSQTCLLAMLISLKGSLRVTHGGISDASALLVDISGLDVNSHVNYMTECDAGVVYKLL